MENRIVKVIAVFISAMCNLVLHADSLTWPISPDMEDYRRITGTFGEYKQRIEPTGETVKYFHQGVDIVPNPCEGAPVLSAVGGAGVKIQYNKFGYDGAGYNVKVFGDYGLYKYMHLAEHPVPEEWLNVPRQALVEGTQIGSASHTGTVDCHLHLQTWAGSKDTATVALNPLMMWEVPDATPCRFEEVRLRLENGYRTITEGTTYRVSGSGEFLVKAHDRTNPDAGNLRPDGNAVNFSILESLYDEQPLKGQNFTNSMLMSPLVGDAYSLSDPASAIPPNAWYRMGRIFLADGRHSLRLRGYNLNNAAENVCGELVRNFSIDTTPVSLRAHSISPLYDNFSGTSTLNPATLERAHTLDFEDAVSGISALVISGPAGFAYSHTFEPPVSTTTLSFENMPLGPYEIRAVDAAGNESVAPFKIVELGVEVSTPDSVFHDLQVTSTLTEYSEKFGCRLAVKTESSSPIERVDIFTVGDGIPSLVQSIPGSEVGPIATFDTGINSELFYSSNNYIVQVWNKDGNSRSRVFGVRRDAEQLPTTDGTYASAYFDGAFIMPQTGARQASFTSKAVDLRAIPYLVDGSVFSLVPGRPYNPYNNVTNPDIVSVPDGSSEKFYGLPIGEYQEIGTVEARLISSDSGDMSGGLDMVIGKRHYFAVQNPDSYTTAGSTCGFAGINHWYYYCYTNTNMSAGIFPLGRYVQSKLVFSMPAPTNILAGSCAASHDSTCDEGYGFTIRGLLLADFNSALIEPVYYYPVGEDTILPGTNVKVPLGSGAYVNFDRVVTAGSIGLSVQHGDTLPGFVAVPAGHSYNVTGGIAFNEAEISFPYEPSGLSADQQSQIRVVRVIDPAKGLFETLPTTLDSGRKLVSARVTSFGKLMVVAPAYATPHQLSEGSAGGGPELEFKSNASVSVGGIPENSIYSDMMLKNLALNNLAPVGNVYYLGPDDTPLSPPGAIKMRYDKAKLSSMGLLESDIGLYEFSSDGSLLFKLPRHTINTETSEVIAEVPKLYSLFGILGKSYQPTPADNMMPETELVYAGITYTAESGIVYIATTTQVILNPTDWDDWNKTGVHATYHFRDKNPDFACLRAGRDITKRAGTCENPVYESAFTLEEGSHTLYYQSVDNAKNYELMKSTEVFVDGTAPEISLLVGTIPVADGGSIYAAESDSVTLVGDDPEIKGGASGLKGRYLLLDTTLASCGSLGPIISTAPVGSCQNYLYTGAFSLTSGTHTIYYTASDNVGNVSPMKTAYFTVSAANPNAMPGGYIRRVAGNGQYGNSADGVPALDAKFGGFYGVVKSRGSVFMVDYSFSVVRKIAPDGKVYTVAGTGAAGYSGDGGPATAAMLNKPNDIALDSAGNIYIADRYNNKVRKVDAATGIISTALEITSPLRVAVDNNDTLYVADGSKVIYKILPDGQRSVIVNGQISSSVGGLAFDANNNLYIADTYNKRIRKVDASGIMTTVAGGGSLQTDNAPALQKDIGYVADVAVAKDGGLLFLDGYRIYHLDLVTGLVGTIIGDGYANVSTAPIPAALTYLSFPQYICIDETGLAYITGNGLVAEMAFPGAKSSSDASVRLFSGNSGVRISSAAAGSAEAATFLAAAGSKGLLPASTIYVFTNSGAALSPEGGLVFKFDPNVAKTTSTLALYAFDGVSLSSAGAGVVLAEQLLQPGSYSMGKFVAARAKKVPYLAGLLMEVSDDRAPRSALTLGQPSYGSNPVYVSSTTTLTIVVEDDKDVVGDKKGLGVAYVMVRILSNGVLSRELRLNNPSPAQGQIFVSTFTLDRDGPGTYSIEYYAVDLRGNREGAKSVLAALDTTPPGVELQADGAVWQDAENFSSLSSYEIRLVSTDSLSGIASQRYLVDIAPEDCVFPAQPVSTAPAGTCQNPIYTTPLHLGVGTHRIYISAEDNVGNRSQFKKYTADVRASWYSNINAWPYYEYRGGLTSSNGAQFSGLVKMGFDPQGNVWIGEGAAGRINIFDSDGNYLRAYSAGLASLQDFSVCPDGTFWALAYVGGRHLLEKFNSSGEVQKEVDVMSTYNVFPRQVACDNGNRPVVAVNSSTSGVVISFDGNGNYAGRFEMGIPQGSYDGLATDSNGNILVADLSSYVDVKIKKFSKTGEFLASTPLAAKSANSIDLDAHGNIYVTDYSSSLVGVYTSTGGLLTAFGDLPVGHQMKVMGQPVASAVHPYTGKLYVGTGNSVAIYGEDHTPPGAPPQILSPVNGVVLYSSAPLAIGMAEAASYVNVFDGGVLLGAVPADRTGQILSNLPGLSVGRHLLQLENADLAGNKSAPVFLDVTVKPVNQLVFSGPVLGPLGTAMSGYNVWDTSATVVADFDRDGRKDVLGFSSGGKYTFYKGSGTGTYTPVYTAQMSGMTPQYSGGDDAVAADFDGDGYLDVAASVYNPLYPYSDNVLVVLKGNGDGTFAEAVVVDHLVSHSGLALGDFNKDGYPDIAAAAVGNVKVYFGGPTSLFLSVSTPIPAELPASDSGGLAMADFDADGHPDILFRNAVLFGSADGGFDGKTILPVYEVCSAGTCRPTVNKKSIVSDFNSDGRPDVALVGMDEFAVFVGTGSRSFAKTQSLRGQYYYSGSAADFNRDGVPDVVISPYRLQNMLVLAGRGDGTFETPVAFPTGGYAQYGHLSGTVAGEDLNSDGKPDILQASSDLMLSDGKYLETFFAFLNTTSAPDIVPPAAVQLAVRNTEEGGVELSWIAPGNDGATGIAWRYDLRYGPAEILNDAQFAGAQHFELSSPRTAGSPEKFTLGTLASGTSYYFALKTYDAAGNVSELSNSPGLFTKYVVKATTTIDGNPEIAMVSAVQPYISYISTLTGSGAVAIGTAAAQALTLAGNMYEIAPEGVYDPPATLTFYYSTSALAAVGLAEDEVFVYEHFAGSGWVKLAGQVTDTLNHKITVPITRIASLFGIFGVVKDKTPPETTFAVTGSSWPMAQNGLYVDGASSTTLTGNDPVVYGTAVGVAFTEFRVDASTSALFVRYLEPFRLSTGAHRVEFRSADNAGNIEEINTRNIFVDVVSPDIAYSLAGATFAAGGTVFVAAGSTVALISSDEASGVRGLSYEINGSTFSEASGREQLLLSTGGAYAITYSAIDNVGNASRSQALSIFVDTNAPVSKLLLDDVPLRDAWYTSVPAVKISAFDDGSNVKETFYRLDGSTFAVYSSSFPVPDEGRHNLGFYSVDNVLNTENARTAIFGVDFSTPAVSYSLSPLPNASGWNKEAVAVVFRGTDTVSGIAYCSSSFTAVGEGFGIPVSGYCSDYAGWSSTVSFALNIDTTSPVSFADVGGTTGQNGWLRSQATVALASTDNLSGVAWLQYVVDGSSFAAYSSSFTVGGSGLHEFSYFAEDKAGNIESVKHETFKVDLEAPAASAQASPQANAYSWNNSAVNVVFTATDSVSGLAYCEPQKTFELEGSSQTVTGYCTDYAGWSSTASLILNIDTTSPRINYTASPVANSLGWNNGEVLVKFTCVDDLSGIMSCPAEIPLSAEGTDISTAAKTVDYAGNFAQAVVSGLKIDKTPPSSSIELSGPQRNGWYSGSVTATLVSTDALSGVKEILYILDSSTPAVYSTPITVAGNGEHAIKYYASDNADNLEGYKSVGFRIDAEAPVVGYRQVPPHNTAGWNNTAVEIVFVGTDTLSGIEACSSATVTLEGQGMSILGWCRDLAGNVAYATATVSIDITRPGLAASAEPQPNAAGWNNSDVRIKYACEDALSGVSDCPLGVVLSGEGVDISTQAVAYDHAGNISMSLASAVKIDRTAPVSAVELSGISRNSWYSGPVGIVIKSTDVLAGIKETRYALDNIAPAVYDGTVLVSGEGAHTLNYYAADRADNVEETRTSEFRIDSSSPAVRYTYTPQPNAAGWNNTAVAVAFSGEDGLSGIEVCSSATVAMEGRGVTVSGWCRDVAGNVSYASAALNIDLTPAAIKIDSPLAGQTYIATRGNISIGFNIKDNLDPAPSVEAYLLQVEDKGSPRGARPAKIAVAAGQSTEPLDIDDGLWRLEVSATDAAGNISHLVGGTFEVIHDMLPPRSSLSQAGPAYRPAGNNYLTSAAVFTVGSIDDLVAASDGIGLGVVFQDVKLNAGPVLLKEFGFTNARPAQGEVFSSTFSFADLPDGLYGLSYGARDVLGNAESAKDWAFALDNTPPMTQYNVSGVAYEAGGKVYMNSTASIGLAGVDVSSGGVASGLLAVKFRLDDSAWGVYSSTFSFAAPGEHLVEYQGMDNVQNAEVVRRLAVTIDNAAPSSQVAVGEPQYEVFGLRIITPETPVTLSAADPGEAGLASGVKGIYYELLDAYGGSTGVRGYTEPIKLDTAGTYVLRYWAMDNAGNIGAPREQRLMVSSLQGDALDAVGGLDMSGSADIAGAVKSNGVVSLGGSARILGDVSASTITLSGNAKITGQRVSGVAPLVPVPLYMPAFVEIASNTNNNALIPAKYLSGGKLVLDAKAELTLSTGVYYFTGIDLKGGSSVILNGNVDVMVAGDVSIAAGSSLNATGVSGKLNIFLSTVSALSFAGGGNLAAYVYAPYADLKLTGNALLGGHYFVKNAFVSGNGNIVQAGETLPTAVPAGGGGGKKVSAMAVQDGTYGVLAGPSTEFRLGEVYVFPNPALRGAAPTFHVEVGIADRVKITIYTVSGRQAHETTLTGMPVALDDGNGLSYAYEYTWRDSIPSGVYFYHIEAEKSGQKIKKSGKFGVVR